MKKIIIFLLVAALCTVTPAVAQPSMLDWDMLPTEKMVLIYEEYSPGGLGTYFDVYILGDVIFADSVSANGGTYPGWCVDTSTNAIRDQPYVACLSSTIGAGAEWNRINWILNNKDSATFVEIQVAILKVLGQNKPPQFSTEDWGNAVSQAMVAAADPAYTPGPGDIGGVLVEPCQLEGQIIIIELPIPREPPVVPEFPAMIIPVFLVGSVLVAAVILRRE